MAAQRTAEAVWEGNLVDGSGTVSMASSGATGEFPVTWAARAESPEGKTSPEELMAAAHAACYAMALSHHLAGQGRPPERLQVSVTYTFVPGTGITAADIAVRGSVAGLSADEFEQAAKDGELGCPVSNAVRGNVQINLTASVD